MHKIRFQIYYFVPIVLMFSLSCLRSDAQSKKDSIHAGGDCFCSHIQDDGTFIQASGVDFRINAAYIEGGRVLVSNGKNAMFIGFGDGTALKKFLNISTTSASNWSLWLERGVVAKNFAITDPQNWADFVFNPEYKLRPLDEVENFIKVNRHLPDIPSEDNLKKEGYTLQDMNSRFMQKIEELTLYSINQDKKIKEQQVLLNRLAEDLDKLEKKLESVTAKKRR